MKKVFLSAMFSLAVALLVFPANAGNVKSLRGELDLTTSTDAADIPKLDAVDKHERTFKEQPPLVPHKFDKYRITLKSNKCLGCHDKKNYKEEEAPMAGKSHFIDARGKEMDTINMGRYFCNQCHVPQMLNKPIVANTFTPAK